MVPAVMATSTVPSVSNDARTKSACQTGHWSSRVAAARWRRAHRGPRGTSSCRYRCRSRRSRYWMSETWRAPRLSRTLSASFAVGAGARPDHPISRGQASCTGPGGHLLKIPLRAKCGECDCAHWGLCGGEEQSRSLPRLRLVFSCIIIEISALHAMQERFDIGQTDR
jgi:hypothetical protein